MLLCLVFFFQFLLFLILLFCFYVYSWFIYRGDAACKHWGAHRGPAERVVTALTQTDPLTDTAYNFEESGQGDSFGNNRTQGNSAARRCELQRHVVSGQCQRRYVKWSMIYKVQFVHMKGPCLHPWRHHYHHHHHPSDCIWSQWHIKHRKSISTATALYCCFQDPTF